MSVRIAALAVYPVKSCRGIAVQEAQLAPTGLVHDRHWMLVRPDGRFVTQRELPRLALIRTQFEAEGVTLTAPGMAELRLPALPGGEARPVVVWKFSGRGLDCGPEAANWVSEFLRTPLSVVAFDASMPRTCSSEWTRELTAITEFSDGFPLLVLSTASLADLNQRLVAAGSTAVPLERFRPNLVIEGVQPYEEDRIHELHVGDVTMRLVKPCSRCAITTTDQQTGEVDGAEPLRTLREYRFDRTLKGVMFGQNAIVIRGAGQWLRVGDSVEIVPK